MESLEGFRGDTTVYKDANNHTWLLTKETKNDVRYFNCFGKGKLGCKATCKLAVSTGIITLICCEHNHDPDPGQIEHLRFLALLRKMAGEGTNSDSFKEIFSQVRRTYEDGALLAGLLHENTTIMKGSRSENLPKQPKSLTELGVMMQDKK